MYPNYPLFLVGYPLSPQPVSLLCNPGSLFVLLNTFQNNISGCYIFCCAVSARPENLSRQSPSMFSRASSCIPRYPLFVVLSIIQPRMIIFDSRKIFSHCILSSKTVIKRKFSPGTCSILFYCFWRIVIIHVLSSWIDDNLFYVW